VSTASRIAVPLLLVAALGGAGAYYFLQQPPPAPTPVSPPVQPTPSETPEQPAPTPVVQAPLAEPPPREKPRSNGDAHADAAQGVRGRVLLPNGAPAEGVPVYLLENLMNDMAQIFVIQRTGRVIPPIASSTTGADGTFQLGVRRLGKAVDLRVVPEQHPEYNRQSIKVRDGDWYDAGDLMLEQGVAVQGRVVDATNKAPIANATVYLMSTQQSHAMVAAPGRERGTPTVTDANGAFRFGAAPRVGLVNLIAEAAGYANGQALNQMLKQDSLNEFTLELDIGVPINGVVVDGAGKPIIGATIGARGLSVKTPQTASTASGEDGGFQFASLRPGPYELTATAPNHADVKVPLALTGDGDVKLVMSTRGSVKLRVVSAAGQPVRAFRLSLKRHFPQNPANIGNVPEFADRQITPGDYPRDFGGEWALVRGLPSGDYRFQITENQHAKTLSDAFAVVEGADPVEVQCTLTLGAMITGTVIDDRGQPVADATVTTDMNGGLAADSELLAIFRSMIPEKHTKQSAKTDSNGKFKIPRLAFADYMVRAAHPDFCEGSQIDLKLESEGQVVDAGVIQLARGAIVEGVTTIAGNPAGQVKVTMSTPMTAEMLPAANKDGTPPGVQPRAPVLFNASVHSDGNGQFRLLKRVPPGTYKATATRPTSGGDPFGTLLDIKQSEQQIVITPGQDRVTVTFQLPHR
jgi:uncharacterized GH25 family protein